jgi:hypothetical protein
MGDKPFELLAKCGVETFLTFGLGIISEACISFFTLLTLAVGVSCRLT